jgi:uncharacterized protein (DUF433 family)
MPTVTTSYEHLVFDETGEPFFKGTRFKVMQLLREHVAYGWSAEELALNHPNLTLGQVYSALAWYADHRERVEAELEKSAVEAEGMHGESKNRRLSRLLKRSAA